ncbi:tyrosine-type recombinase/integrase [Glaesserella parasuis]|uniref:tyrosine-type recombinase/integrase n=4 Tax=Glaesserella parasuis TaxID=738 RepID=UPI0003AC3184|nr:integrase arm-type DNA-binding domain-containing protein [Glaesserella parasuis]AIK89509.1 integrase [Glaesserella parasuis]EQA10412.1 phage integrase family protein [Glaesserella parasuis 84-15995]KDD81260.1 integrase [Glaesserella parasuis ST4-1]KDD81894.1 integrase [Glaesserella parasuis ST4-2]MCT8544959.1 tyrosine-type recombinase/integrase [Glaesserella parasuis]
MARKFTRLSAMEIKEAKPKNKEYSLHDGDGLLLRIRPTGSKTWLFNYSIPFTKKRTNLRIGSFPEISLIQARAKREEFRALLAQNIDLQAEKLRQQEEAQSQIRDTFYSVSTSYFNGIYKQKAKNAETRENNWTRLENHIFPYIGEKHVSEITVRTLVQVYEKAANRSNTLKKVHQLVSVIMDHAVTKGIIESHNCRLAIKSFYIESSKPNPTIKPSELPKLFQDLSNSQISKKTYFLICWSFLTALRPNEAVSAEWAEIDFENKLWNIPKEKMKGQADKKRPHTVPLSSQAIQLLEIMKFFSEGSRFIFVGRSSNNQPMNKATVNVTLKRIGYKNKLTAHGIRAFIKTFLASQKIERNVSETVLSHLLEGGDDLENTYNRYDYLEERKSVMQLIGDYCESRGMDLTFDVKKQSL